MISVIIPTLNEALYLPMLFESLEKQQDSFEVIVVDGESTDRTCEIVRKYSGESIHTVRLIQSKKGVANQRNKGANEAHFDIILFLDADVILPDNFIRKCHDQILKDNLMIAGTKIYAAEKQFHYRSIYWLYSNFYLPVMRLFNPVLHGCSIFVTKDLHYKINGFDDDVTFEDFRYARKASEITKVSLIKGAFVYTSARRYYNPSFRELGELIISGLYSIYRAGINGKGFMKKFHEKSGKHDQPKYS